jgi:hypothetical protein
VERLAAQLCRTNFIDEESIPMRIMVHTHTTFSGDGELHPQVLANLAKSRGFAAVLVSDHFESLRPHTFRQLVQVCHGITNCLMIPGYERSFRGYHVLALSVEEWIDDADVKSWASRVRTAGGITAIAHPCRYNHDIPADILSSCDAVEVWNSKFGYDGEFAPNPRAYRLLADGRYPLCSQDLHGVRHASPVGIQIDKACNTGSDILDCLRRGEYRMTNGVFSFGPELTRVAASLLGAFHISRTRAVKLAIATRRRLRRIEKRTETSI